MILSKNLSRSNQRYICVIKNQTLVNLANNKQVDISINFKKYNTGDVLKINNTIEKLTNIYNINAKEKISLQRKRS